MRYLHGCPVPYERWEIQRKHCLARHILAKVKPGYYRMWLTHVVDNDGITARPRSPQPGEKYLQSMKNYLRINQHVLAAQKESGLSPEGDFLHYWKRGIDLVGISAFSISLSHHHATTIYQLLPPGLDRVKEAMHGMNQSQRVVMAAMYTLYDPDIGYTLPAEYRFSVKNLADLSPEQMHVLTGLFYTFNTI
jgi:hypothetical protein